MATSAKKAYMNFISPVGEALFPHLTKPEEYEGKEVGFTITMKFNKEDTEKVAETINSELEKAKEEMELKPGQKWSADPFLGMHEDKNGHTVFKFKAAATIKLKDGSIVNRKVPVFDAKGNKVDNPDFGNGSLVKVCYQLVPFWVSKAVNGISLRLIAVQLLKKETYGGRSADDYGFSVEDTGYDVNEDKEAVPFMDSAEDADSDF